MVVAIDGPAGCGKSTVAKYLSKKLNFFYLNSGNFYRAVTSESLSRGFSVNDIEYILDMTRKGQLTISNGKLFFFNTDMEPRLHNKNVDSHVSQYSAIPELRALINNEIIRISHSTQLIVEGRDMTTVVFPDADVKIYLDALATVRAHRRFIERPEGLTYEAILSGIETRDQLDRGKLIGGLKIATDAIYVDTSYLTIPEVCDKVLEIIKQKIKL